jgi:hypothetical protein
VVSIDVSDEVCFATIALFLLQQHYKNQSKGQRPSAVGTGWANSTLPSAQPLGGPGRGLTTVSPGRSCADGIHHFSKFSGIFLNCLTIYSLNMLNIRSNYILVVKLFTRLPILKLLPFEHA